MFPKATPGMPASKTPLASSAFVNDLVDIRNAYLPLGDATLPAFLAMPTDLVKVKNITGDDAEQFRVLQLGDYLLGDIDFRAPWFEADAVAYPACAKYAILREPIKDDAIGWAQVSGVCVARVDVTDEDHRYAMPVEGELVLRSCAIGPIELLSEARGDPDVDIEQDMWVRLCVQGDDAFAVAAEAITARTTTTTGAGDVTFWKMDDAGVLSATTMVEEARNWTGGAIDSGALVRVRRHISGLLIVVGQDCSGVALS